MEKKKYVFEAETERLLNLLTHSIYSNKEIFLRELISNSSDAIDKARIKSLTDTSYLGDDANFEIKIETDEKNNIITISDNGIGMTKDELIKNIGTIAKSGTKDFLEKLKDTKESNSLIGQFGVGFYSVFMVASKVELETKSHESKKGILWTSEGKGSYHLEETDKKNRGTIIKIYLNETEKEFAKDYKIRELIKKYSNYIGVPIMMKEFETEENKNIEKKFEIVNETQAIWKRNKSEIKEEEYNNFYSQISLDFSKPLTHLHINTEGMVSYKSILFIPNKKNMFLGNDDPNKDYGPKLFVQNVLILEKAKDLLPVWLRFVSGVVETSDIPLNISREMLQVNPNIEKIKKSLTKKIIEKLKYELKENPEKYDEFLNEFSRYLKEGVYYEENLKEEIAGLIKYNSLIENKLITLDEYIKNLEGTEDSLKKIYYITAKNKKEAQDNPYIEQFRKKGIDVLLFIDTIDEWVLQTLKEYSGIKFVSITSSELDLENKEEKEEIEKKSVNYKDLNELIKNTIGTEKLENVKLTSRLGENIGALTTKEGGINPQMEKIMKSMGQMIPPQKRILEINPDNKIIQLMLEEFKKDVKSEKLKNMILYVYEQAILLEGGELEDYKGFIDRINKFIN